MEFFSSFFDFLKYGMMNGCFSVQSTIRTSFFFLLFTQKNSRMNPILPWPLFYRNVKLWIVFESFKIISIAVLGHHSIHELIDWMMMNASIMQQSLMGQYSGNVLLPEYTVVFFLFIYLYIFFSSSVWNMRAHSFVQCLLLFVRIVH